MPTMTYSLSSFTKTNIDMAAGASFTAYASGSPVSNASITSGSLYLSSLKTYSSAAYLDFSLGSGSGSTTNFSNNSSAHSDTVGLGSFGNGLLTAGSGTISFTLRRTTSGSGNLFNLRDGLTGTLTLNYNLNYTACGAPTAVSVSATNVAPGASITLSWSGATSGTGNAVTGYQIYRSDNGGAYTLLTSVSTTAGSGSVAVTAPSASGASYYYKVLTVGTVGGYNSGQSSATATLTCSYSATTAPGTVTIGGDISAYALSGSSVTLAWSGAAAGTNNPITGYFVYRDGAFYTSVSASATSGSWSVPAHTTAGSSYSYTVRTMGSYADSALSAARVLYTYSAPTAPTTLGLNPAIANVGGSATLSWSGAAAGSFNAITGYEVHRATAAGGPYSLLTTVSTTGTSGSFSVTANATMGGVYYYKIVTAGTRSGSAISSGSISLATNSVPGAPGISAPVADKTTYNNRPRILVTVSKDNEDHPQTLALSGYAASTTGSVGFGKKIVYRRSAALTAPGAQSVSITATDSIGGTSAAATRSFAYAAPGLTDTTLVAGSTTIKAAHMNELRARVNDVRAYYGLTAYAWAAAIAAGQTSLAGWKSHVLELRTAIDEVVALVNGWDAASATNNIVLPAWIDIPANKPTVAVMNQLRDALLLL